VLLVIDNYDSFTYNLVQYLGELGCNLSVYRNDQITLTDIDRLNPIGVVISPGPGSPDTAGISLDLIRTFGPRLPILGVCLGHQSIGQVFGGQVIRAPQLMHGKTSLIYHNESGVFQGLSNPFEATRYHSLMVDAETCPSALEVTAWTEDPKTAQKLIMGLRHRQYPHIQGVQFHPESILTKQGKQLLTNFVKDLQRMTSPSVV
jgi:anthranilate synthase component 2